jgi:hypothetical protein
MRRLRIDEENTSTSYNDESEKIAIEMDDSIDTNRRFVRRIQKSEVKETLKKMKTDKTLGPYDIPIEV